MNFRKFTMKYAAAVTIIPSVAVFGVATALTWNRPDISMYNGMIALAVMFLTSFALRRYNASFIRRAERSLYDECDPFPMLEETKLYLECAGKRINKAGITLTLAMMTALSGDYDEAERKMKSIDVSDTSSLPDGAKAGVFYDLAALYCAMNLRSLAVEHYDRTRALFERAPDRLRYKMNFNGPTDGEIECYKGHGSAALNILNSIDPVNRLQEVTKNFALAKVHYILGERDAALGEFSFVAENGGRLACAKEAREIVEFEGK